jgi:hypothetical protein
MTTSGLQTYYMINGTVPEILPVQPTEVGTRFVRSPNGGWLPGYGWVPVVDTFDQITPYMETRVVFSDWSRAHSELFRRLNEELDVLQKAMDRNIHRAHEVEKLQPPADPPIK